MNRGIAAPAAMAGRRAGWWAAAGLLFVLMVAGRAIWVGLFSESVPYWDQWDSEGAFLLKPWIEGAWEWTRLFDPHNEHRIAFTRLIALMLFEANDGQWDNLVSAYFNTLVYAGAATLAFCLLAPGLGTRPARVAFFLLLLALAWLPFGHENTLVGFQNQFYLMGAFALLVLAVAARARDDAWLPLKLAAVAVPGLFTMASGLLGAVAAVPVLAARALTGRSTWRNAMIASAMMLAIAAAGYMMVPHLAGHDNLKAPDLATWLSSFGKTLGWPLSKSFKGLWVMWMPTVIALWQFVRRRQASAHQLIALGLSGWVLLQCAAIGYSRGNDMAVVSGRYLDTLALGIIANAWLALHIAGQVRPRAGARLGTIVAAIPALLLAGALVLSFTARTPDDVQGARHRWNLSAEQTINVRGYLRSGEASQLDKPHLHIPYPHANRLARLLDDPTLRGVLPASIRVPLPITGGDARGDFRVVERPAGGVVTSCATSGPCGPGTGNWRSGVLRDGYPYLRVPVQVEGPADGLELAWSRADGSGNHQVPLVADAATLAFIPAAGVILDAVDASAVATLKMQPPAAAGGLSMIAARLQEATRDRLGAGSSALRTWRRRSASETLERDPVPLQIASGQAARFEWQAPQDGRVAAIAINIGNYFGEADGRMTVEICARGGCVPATRPLRESLDNNDFELPLESPLPVSRGEALSISLSTQGATHPVALWMFARARNSASTVALPDNVDDVLLERAPRLVLAFDD